MVTECAICLCPIERSATGSCAHHFCYGCLLEWVKTSSSCPKCRFEIREIRLDPEFDDLLKRREAVDAAPAGESSGEAEAPRIKQPVIRLKLDPRHGAGITLTNPQSGPGVLVACLKPNGRAYESGLRVADIIVSLNGLPATSHEQSIRMIEEATQAAREIVCTLLSRDPCPPAGTDEEEAAPLQVRGRVTHRKEGGVVYFALTVLDGNSSVQIVEHRYSRWREIWQAVCARTPAACTRLSFPPKALHLSEPSEAFLQRRGAALERFVRELLVLPLDPEWLRDALGMEEEDDEDEDDEEEEEDEDAGGEEEVEEHGEAAGRSSR